MKPLTTILMVSLFVSLGLVVLSHPETRAEGAVVINDATCGMLDGDGNFIFADSSHSVETSSNNDNSVFICKASNVPNSTGKAVRYDFDSTGLPCGTLAGSTNKWHETVSASGEAKLVCQFKN